MKRILIVDDEKALLRSFKRLLQGPDVAVDTADTSAEAARLMAANRYHLVVTDLRLNETDREEGLAIAAAAKRRNASTVVILITAYGSNSVRERSAGAGVDHYLEKPVTPTDIQGILDKV